MHPHARPCTSRGLCPTKPTRRCPEAGRTGSGAPPASRSSRSPPAGRDGAGADQSALCSPPGRRALKGGAGARRRVWVRAVAGASTSAWPGAAGCAPGAGSALHVAFLSRGGPGAAARAESAWGGRGPRACWVRRDPRLARAFRAACARRSAPAAPDAALRRDPAALWRLRASCTDPAPPAEPPRRRRRGWTFPGTLWCGAGDSEGNARELVLFRGPDRCCREHDQCSAQITALQCSYGIRNCGLHTISHCCDARFRQCMLDFNDTISNIIGVTFLNLVEGECSGAVASWLSICCSSPGHTLLCCRWLGCGRVGVRGRMAHDAPRCESYSVVPLARMVQQCQNDYSLPTGTGSPAVQPPGKGGEFSRVGHTRLQQGLSQNLQLYQARRPATAQQPQGPGTLSPASTRDKAEPTSRHAAARGLEPMPPRAMTLEQDLAGGRLVPGEALQGSGGSAHPACPQDDSIQSSLAVEWCRAPQLTVVAGHRQQQGEWVLGVDLGRVCKSYKHLDKCEHQFVPSEVKYQLHNMDRTLFHCNCTRRLAWFLHRMRDLSDMELAFLANRGLLCSRATY
ncbi:LOW QUALITY PROTEIN: group 3 secretory phospholipase A2 [Amazona ochrocephala]